MCLKKHHRINLFLRAATFCVYDAIFQICHQGGAQALWRAADHRQPGHNDRDGGRDRTHIYFPQIQILIYILITVWRL